MVNPKLQAVCQFVHSWCAAHGVGYSHVCNEADFQGILLLRKNRAVLEQLFHDLKPIVTEQKIHFEATRVRSGVILALSLKAISESRLAALISDAGEEIDSMTFTERLSDAFTRTTAALPVTEFNEGTFLATAVKIVGEGQFKSATQGITRANQSSLQRQRVGSNRTLGGAQNPPPAKGGGPVHDSDDPQATTGASQAATGRPTRFENRVGTALGCLERDGRSRRDFYRQLTETLQGMATPTGIQPGDLFTKFAQALSVLGQNMGTGPLQDQLKKQGINWKKSDDGQSIILYIVNAQTSAPQPIARISAATLEKPSDFETQLLNIMDFAKGDAPGTFKQRQQELQTQEKAARDIAKQLGPQDPNAVQQQMQQGMAQPGMQQGMAQPAGGTGQPVSSLPAPQAAAQQAAMPKPV
jgi:hypothetical protein